MTTHRRRLAAGLLASAALLALAMHGCSLLLQYDEVETGSGGAAAAGGSAGGSVAGGGAGGGAATGGGGAGGGAAAPYECHWKYSNHVTVATIEDTSGDDRWDNDLFSASSSGQMRLVVFREGGEGGAGGAGSACSVEVRRIRDSSIDEWCFFTPELEDMRRLGSDSVGLLYYLTGVQGKKAMLRVIPDSDIDGSTSSEHQLTTDGAFSDSISYVHAMMAAIDDGPTVDLSFAYPIAGGHREHYAHYTGNAVTPVAITEPALIGELTDDDIHLTALFHHEGLAYVVLGEWDSSLGVRMYTLETNVSGPESARTIAPEGTMLELSKQDDGVYVLAVPMAAEPPHIRLGRVAFSDLDTFVLDDLPATVALDQIDEFPGGDGAHTAWIGQIWAAAGGTMSDPSQFAYFLLDVDGNPRGQGTLPFQGQLASGETRDADAIMAVTFAEAGPLFDTVGGDLHVAWIEKHHHNGTPTQVLYYDQLLCYP